MKGSVNKSELIALLNLMDDPDPEIFSKVEHKVVEIGAPALPYIENAYNNSEDDLSSKRLETLSRKIKLDKTITAIQQWQELPEQNLIEACIILAKYHYPKLDHSHIKDQIERLKKDVWLELNEEFTALEKINILNHVFFEIYNFKGNKTNINQPQNSLIIDLLEQKQGNSVILSILYLEIAQSMEIPVYSVNLPENFILAYQENTHLHTNNNQALFYINPFNQGVIFSRQDINTFITQLDLPSNEEYYKPCSKQTTLKRLMNELLQSYELSGDYTKSQELKTMINRLYST
ncbi:MAG: hypothetical protein B7C24_03210 [Bacteroidetes bacterium 4572_77]|nr:MAG: hypothetical protein B7C24_03210 [Bacteroidetes bacterium 4572_77]